MAEYDPTASSGYDAPFAVEDDNEQQFEQMQGDDDDDYDPSLSFGDGDDTIPALQNLQSANSEQPPAGDPNQSKTIGGFLMSDDDANEEQDPQPQSNGTHGKQPSEEDAVAVKTPQALPVASEPSQEEATAHAAQQSAPLNGSNSPVPNSNPVSNDATIPLPAAAEAQTQAKPQDEPSLPSVSAPTIQSPIALEGKQQDHALPSNAVSAVQSATATPQPAASAVAAPSTQTAGAAPTATTQRLPHDKVGQLEDRIKDEPKADTEAWWALIEHYREKQQIDMARKVFERFLEVFPTSASIWLDYVKMELSEENRPGVENIFNRTLLKIPSLDLWVEYLNYLRRINPLVSDSDGSKRRTISSAFDLLLDNVGIDPESGSIWREWIDFIKTGPGVVGGQGWQDAQKVDLLRKAYQRAVRLPHSELTKLWKDYDNFELQVNKQTARKFMQEHSPYYMQARMAKTQIDQRFGDIAQSKNALPVLPPLHGYEGEDAFAAEVELQRAIVEFWKQDPLAQKQSDMASYRQTVVYWYRQATGKLRFYPDIWYEAAMWCFEEASQDKAAQDMLKMGEEFLDNGIKACPESPMLALKKAARVEASLPQTITDEEAIKNGDKLDPVFGSALDSLYALHKKMVAKMESDMNEVKAYYAGLSPEEDNTNGEGPVDDDEDEDAKPEKPKTRKEQEEDHLSAVKKTAVKAQEKVRNTISYVWIEKMRAFARVQGQGSTSGRKKGLRGVFAEARPKGQITGEVYVASAMTEAKRFDGKAANKIFDRGFKLYPLDEAYAMKYMDFLSNQNDQTNARATFEMTMSKIAKAASLTEEEKKDKFRPLLGWMHHYEVKFGTLAQINAIEKRIRDMFPQEKDIDIFKSRYIMSNGFNALTAQLMISPTQAQPKKSVQATDPGAPILPQAPLPSAEHAEKSPPGSSNIRLGPNGPYIASPKRGLDDSDSDAPARKYMRAESPLKGAAGRRIQSHGAPQPPPSSGGSGFMTKTYIPGQQPPQQQTAYSAPVPNHPAPLPYALHDLLGRLPSARYYGASQFDPVKMVEFMRSMNLPERR